MRLRTAVLIALIAILANACSRLPPTTSPSLGALLAGSPSATETTSLAPTARPVASLDAELEQAVKFRHDFGLRSDLPFVIASLTDPRATDQNFGLPLYPEEAAKLLADQADQDAAIPIVVGYGMGHADEYGGVYIDRADHIGMVTVLWTDHLSEHATTLAGLLGGHAIIVRQVRYSYAELETLKERVFSDIDWMEAIPARMQGLGVDIVRNVIEMDVSSAEPSAAQQIEAHYSLGDKLSVTSDGTGVVFIPRGDIKGRVLGVDGRRVRGTDEMNVDYEYRADNPGDCGGGDIGYGLADDGTFQYPCQAGRRTIVITAHDAKGRNVVLGRATVMVIAGQTVHVTIRLTRNP